MQSLNISLCSELRDEVSCGLALDMNHPFVQRLRDGLPVRH